MVYGTKKAANSNELILPSSLYKGEKTIKNTANLMELPAINKKPICVFNLFDKK